MRSSFTRDEVTRLIVRIDDVASHVDTLHGVDTCTHTGDFLFRISQRTRSDEDIRYVTLVVTEGEMLDEALDFVAILKARFFEVTTAEDTKERLARAEQAKKDAAARKRKRATAAATREKRERATLAKLLKRYGKAV